jgi:hypothetical protein
VSVDACQCKGRKYLASGSGTTLACADCPSGAECEDRTCAFGLGNRSCALGTWQRDEVSGEYWLKSCPAGHETQNTSYDVQQCFKCDPDTRYIVSPDTDSCQKCPPGLLCFGNARYTPKLQNSTWSEYQVPGGSKVFKLENCPRGHMKVSDGVNWDQQQCVPCPAGEEFVEEICTKCTLCSTGKYKLAAGPQACQPCPKDTYNPEKGAATLAQCQACPSISTTQDAGQTNISACQCPEDTYVVTDAQGATGMVCQSCPVGARCADSNFDVTCALRSYPFACAIKGDWKRIRPNGVYRVDSCPIGHKLTLCPPGEDSCLNTGCQACPNEHYILNTSDPGDECRACPSSAKCINGRPPIFKAKSVQGKLELSLPPGSSDEDIRRAVADKLGVDPSMIVLPNANGRRAEIVFQIVGEASDIESLADTLAASGVVVQQVETGDDQMAEGEVWEEVDGQYILTKCPAGRILQEFPEYKCEECDANSYALEGSTSCVKCPGLLLCLCAACS